MRKPFALLFLLISFGIAQNTSSQKLFVDVILSKSSSTKVLSFYQSMDSVSKATLFFKMSVVDTISELSCKEICNSFNDQKAMYDSNRVPDNITAIYNTASSYIDNNQLREGVKVFYVAYALKKDFIEREKDRLLQNYQRTKYFIQTDVKDSILSYIELFEKENVNTISFIILDKELDLTKFYQHIKEEITEKTKDNIYELEHQDLFNAKLAFEIYVSGNISSDRKTPTLRITNYQTFEEELKNGFEYQQSYISFNPTLALSLELLQNMRLSFGFSWNSFRIESLVKHDNPDEIIFFESNYLKISTYQYEILGKYLFRPNIGLRPFVETGFGINNNHAEGKKLLAIYRYTFYSVEQSNTSYYFPFKAGIEYVYSKNSAFYYTVSCGGQYFLNNTNIIGKNSIQVNIAVNIVLQKI